MCYPEKIIRGIASKSFVDSEGRLSSEAFQFLTNPERTDGFEEASINWYDNEEAFQIAWNQKKSLSDDTFQFKAGVAILSREFLDSIIVRPNIQKALEYERQPIDGNKYHGNLLRKVGLEKQIQRMVASAIALSMEMFIPRNE